MEYQKKKNYNLENDDCPNTNNSLEILDHWISCSCTLERLHSQNCWCGSK